MGLFHRKPREERRRRGPTRLLGFLLLLAIAAAVVLGTGMTKVHTTEETITVENLYRTAVLAQELLIY